MAQGVPEGSGPCGGCAREPEHQVQSLALSLGLGDLGVCLLASISLSFPFCAMEVISYLSHGIGGG